MFNGVLFPGNPSTIYRADWESWVVFLRPAPQLYETYAQAQAAVQALAINDYKEYSAQYRRDNRLPKAPKALYSNWGGWADFLGKNPHYYATYLEAKTAVQAYGFKGQKEYIAGYKIDPMLPTNPKLNYEADWASWSDFLIPNKADSWIKAKVIVQHANIKSAKDYRKRYEDMAADLPVNPEKIFKEWQSWNDFLSIEPNSFYTYAEAAELMQVNGVKSHNEYQKYRTTSQDNKLYATPNNHYQEWLSWPVFLGIEEPFQPWAIRGVYLAWKRAIINFINHIPGGHDKKNVLCKFERLYIEQNSLGNSPIEFLIAEKIDMKIFELFLNTTFTANKKSNALKIIKEFLNAIIRNELTSEDEKTGEFVPINNARNPFDNVYVKTVNKSYPSESVKLLLPFAYILEAIKWIIPDDANVFSDLKHLYDAFDSDWKIINPDLIDSSDQDAIIRQNNDGTSSIWSPINWLHTYVLMELPLRGAQIAYNDSGEADVEIPDINSSVASSVRLDY